ncbi:hypothetical protein F5Y16DRAFT_369769 [Xylariaceae sp. FL0255]|nr:hypothetical protein F5Y16DRAFT_369769 [Xylariaceae sp. FL0255]
MREDDSRLRQLMLATNLIGAQGIAGIARLLSGVEGEATCSAKQLKNRCYSMCIVLLIQLISSYLLRMTRSQWRKIADYHPGMARA